MVEDIPSPSDFQERGIDFLNLAWSTCITILDHSENVVGEMQDVLYDDSEVEEKREYAAELKERFNRGAQRELGTAITLACQGTEFLLKSKICETSPWLLILARFSDWPKGCHKKDIPFSQFRTADAQDLVEIHDTTASERLPPEFVEKFSKLRILRNSLMHSVSGEDNFSPISTMETILDICQTLIGKFQWLPARKNFLARDRDAPIVEFYDQERVRIVEEMDLILEALPRAAIRKLGIDKTQRRYSCPSCRRPSRDIELRGFFAQLRPNESDSTKLFCFVCGETHTIERKDCVFDGCRGNVIDPNLNECLTCGLELSEV